MTISYCHRSLVPLASVTPLSILEVSWEYAGTGSSCWGKTRSVELLFDSFMIFGVSQVFSNLRLGTGHKRGR